MFELDQEADWPTIETLTFELSDTQFWDTIRFYQQKINQSMAIPAHWLKTSYSYDVVCDATNNTPLTKQQNELHVTIRIDYNV